MAYKYQTIHNKQLNIEEWYVVRDDEVATGHIYMFSRPVQTSVFDVGFAHG